jgi:hypothetical protein
MDKLKILIKGKAMNIPLLLMMLSLAIFTSGCATHSHDGLHYESTPMQAMSLSSPAMEAKAKHSSVVATASDSEQARKLIKRSWLLVGVKDLSQAEKQAKSIIDEQQGYIQNSQGEQGKSFNLSVRVPQENYQLSLKKLRTVGDIISENENVQDVTTEFIDNQARLDNLYKLRDRIRLLLDKAERIEDILRIERELNRTQSEIDRLEGRMKYLKGQVDYASIEFTAEKQKTYGPLGYFFMGIWWGIEKLFVWDQ